MAERNRLTKKIYTKTSQLSLKELRRMLKTERDYINKQISKLNKMGLSSSAAVHYKVNPISLSQKLSYQQIRKEVLKAKTFFSSKDWTVEGAEEYSRERQQMYDTFAEMSGEEDAYGADLAGEIFELYEDTLAQFPSHLRKMLESDQDSILEEIEEELQYARGVSYEELRQKLYQSAYDRIGDFFSSSTGRTKLRET